MAELRQWCPKILREQLCNQQTFAPDDFTRREIQRLIDVLDLHRPLASNGKHGNLHTPTCGCDDLPAAGPQPPETTGRTLTDEAIQSYHDCDCSGLSEHADRIAAGTCTAGGPLETKDSE